MSVAISTPHPYSPAHVPSRFARRWAPWLLVFNLVGYSFVGLVASLLNIDSTIASIPFRAVVLLLSFYVILGSSPHQRWWSNNIWLVAFWFVYILRLLYDSFVTGVPGAVEALGFFVSVCLIPSAASGMNGILALSEKRSAWRLAMMGGLICVFTVFMNLFGLGASRALNAISTGGRLGFEALNPITIGHVAASTLIALVCLTRTRMPAANHLLLMAIGSVAIWSLLLAGSRGPMISLAGAGVAYAFATGRWKSVLLLIGALAASIIYGDSVLIERFSNSATDASSLERLMVQGNAILQFLGSPIYGSAYTELESLEWPHNLFIETAMALGVIGLLLLLIVLFRSARLALRAMRGGQFLIPMLFTQYFIGFQLSGSLWASTPFWVGVALLGSYPLVKRVSRRARTSQIGGAANPQ